MATTEKPPRLIRFYHWIWRFWKEKRFDRFVEALQPGHDDKLLDIGGYPFNWYRRGNIIGMVDVLNLDLAHEVEAPAGAPIIRAISGDARRLSFNEGAYDIVFSNSVIEHVGSLEDQRDFANEARRVGKRIWVQTPAKACPIEPHYLGPFIHWFPRSWHARMARWMSIRGITRSANREELEAIAKHTRLMTKREFASLFPDCEILTERMFLVLPKSYIAVRGRGR